MEEFTTIDKTKIYLDYVFLDFDNTPMIFTCKNEKNSYYLGVCCSMVDEFRFLLADINMQELVKIINKNFDLYNYFLSKRYVYQFCIDMDLKTETKKIEINSLNEDIIPGKNVYIKDTSNVRNYIYESYLEENFKFVCKNAVEGTAIINKIISDTKNRYKDYSPEYRNFNYEVNQYIRNCIENDDRTKVTHKDFDPKTNSFVSVVHILSSEYNINNIHNIKKNKIKIKENNNLNLALSFS